MGGVRDRLCQIQLGRPAQLAPRVGDLLAAIAKGETDAIRLCLQSETVPPAGLGGAGDTSVLGGVSRARNASGLTPATDTSSGYAEAEIEPRERQLEKYDWVRPMRRARSAIV